MPGSLRNEVPTLTMSSSLIIYGPSHIKNVTSLKSTSTISSWKHSRSSQSTPIQSPSLLPAEQTTPSVILSTIPGTTGFDTAQLRPALNTETIVGIAIGFTLLVVVSGGMFCLFCSRRRRAVGLNSRAGMENGQRAGNGDIDKGVGMGATTVVTIKATPATL